MLQCSKHDGLRYIRGPFKLTTILHRPDRRKRDVDNLNKCLLDLLKSLRITDDDSACQEQSSRWGTADEAPMGCCLILESVKD